MLSYKERTNALLTLAEGRTRADIITTCKFLSGFKDGEIEQLFVTGRDKLNRGHNRKLSKGVRKGDEIFLYKQNNGSMVRCCCITRILHKII